MNIGGAGEVTGSWTEGSLDCTRSAGNVQSGTCEATVPDRRVCNGGVANCDLVAQDVTVTAKDVTGTGYTFDHWSDCTSSATQCTVQMDEALWVGAVFRDVQPPSLSWGSVPTGPQAGTIKLSASATDNAVLTHVDLLVRGVVVAARQLPPYAFDPDTHAFSHGAAQVRVIAYDTSDLARESRRRSRSTTPCRPSP